MRIVFDLDGVLVETRRANELAYRFVGVVPPGNHHVVPWQTWTTAEVHDAKNAALENFMDEIRALPLLGMVSPRTVILSNCSDAALVLIRRKWPVGLWPHAIFNNLNANEKANWLRTHSPAGVYFDDSAETCALVAAQTEWQVCRVM